MTKERGKCPMCFGTNIDGFSDRGVTCALCHGETLSKEREAAFRLLLPSDVIFWAGGGPILGEEVYFSIIRRLGTVGLKR